MYPAVAIVYKKTAYMGKGAGDMFRGPATARLAALFVPA